MLARDERYSRVAIAFHWAIAAFALFNLFVGLIHDYVPRSWGLIPIHKSVGVTILVLTLGRLGWRLLHRPPALPAALPGWEKAFAHTVHWAFYVLLIALPLSGWAFLSNPARPRPVSWFGLFDLPLLPVDSGIAHLAREAHEWLGWVMLALVVIHIAAALRHQFVLRDTVLARMLPGVRPLD